MCSRKMRSEVGQWTAEAVAPFGLVLVILLGATFGLAYAPTYSVVFTFVIMVVALAFRPRGIMGRAG